MDAASGMGVSVERSTSYCTEISDWYGDCEGSVQFQVQFLLTSVYASRTANFLKFRHLLTCGKTWPLNGTEKTYHFWPTWLLPLVLVLSTAFLPKTYPKSSVCFACSRHILQLRVTKVTPTVRKNFLSVQNSNVARTLFFSSDPPFRKRHVPDIQSCNDDLLVQ